MNSFITLGLSLNDSKITIILHKIVAMWEHNESFGKTYIYVEGVNTPFNVDQSIDDIKKAFQEACQ